MANFKKKHTQNKATTLIFQYDVHEYFPCMNIKKNLEKVYAKIRKNVLLKKKVQEQKRISRQL